ncbi:MAG: FtsW/RodA/SpoVE family cell cycle protein, partial [Clostridiales bacterium]|nr:FtsW/RodA/SpoVE family cell cycle protein [Clostridiales bacterium]
MRGGGLIYELVVLLCRFLFIFYIVYFLILGLEYLLDERQIKYFNRGVVISKQRLNIIFMHVTGFMLLAYIPGTFSFDIDKLLLAVGGVVFIIYGFYAANKIFPQSCPMLWSGVFFLLDVSLIILGRLDHNLAKRQLLMMFLGLTLTFFIPLFLKIIPKSYNLKYLYLSLATLLLLSTFALGSEKNGAINWININGFSFQPSELVKFLFVFYLAAEFKGRLSIKKLIAPGAFSAFFIFILVVQRDLGGALIFFMTFMVMMYIATGSGVLFGLGLGAFSLAAGIAYKLFNHVRVRVLIFLDPWSDFYGSGNQISNSLFAIGTFGLLGSGLGRGTPLSVPVVKTDFIFAAICEELGGIFGLCLLAICVVIYYRGVHISLRAS